MKQMILRTLTVAGLAVVTGAFQPAAAAQRLTVSVPFSFFVGGTQMAPGDYSVVESDNGMVTFIGAKTSIIVLTVPGELQAGDQSGLNFVTSENRQVLTGIHAAGSVEREVPVHTSAGPVKLVASAR